MGDRFGHETLTLALGELQGMVNSLLRSETIETDEELFFSAHVLPNWPDLLGLPPPPPPPPTPIHLMPEWSGPKDKGSHDARGGSHDAHDAAGVVEAIGLFTALARGDIEL